MTADQAIYDIVVHSFGEWIFFVRPLWIDVRYGSIYCTIGVKY